VADQYVYDAERKRRVGARQRCDVDVALLGRRAAIRIDRNELRAAPLRFLCARPEVQARRDRIAAPDDDEAAVLELLDVHADRGADDRGPSRLAGGRADRAIEKRCAQAMEEATIHRRALEQPHRSRVAVRKDRLRAVARPGDRLEALCDLVERLVPRDAREAALALGADAAHREAQP